MPVFDVVTRTYSGPAEYSEQSFAYYNRSSRPEVTKVRDLIDKWFDSYPDEEKEALRSRLRADNISFYSGFFELFLYSFLTVTGHEVQVHPVVPSTLKRPDFLVTPRSGEEAFFLEGVVVSGQSASGRVDRKLQDRIQDDVNAFNSPNFFFILSELSGRPHEYPKRRDLHHFLQQVLTGLDPDDVVARIEAGEPIAQTLAKRFEHKGLTVELYPWPKSKESRGQQSGLRSLGAGPVRVRRSRARETIREVIKHKAGRYGSLGRAYVIAINYVSEWGVEEDEVREALFGREVLRVHGGDMATELVYEGEGAFLHKGNPTNKRVSAVLACRSVAPHAISQADLRLYHHIAPSSPYSGLLRLLPQALVSGNRVQNLPGSLPSVREILGLPPHWPYS